MTKSQGRKKYSRYNKRKKL